MTSSSPNRCAKDCSTGSTRPTLAALVSCFTFQRRGPDGNEPLPPRHWPSSTVARRARDIERVWRDLNLSERDERLPETRRPDPGFTEAIQADHESVAAAAAGRF